MIEVKDEELLNFLMTSDFVDEYSPEELKYLLHKWRYFYRLINGKNEQLAYLVDDSEKKIKLTQDDCINKIEANKKEMESLRHKIYNYENKKLTYKERFSGKITPIKDENK
jgi:hypothetical protein